jgi:hypothetical protein
LILLAGLAAYAQSSRKPGLYEVTSTLSFGGASLPPGMPSGAGNPMAAPRTTQVCVTQEMIDKYGGPNPSPQRGDCQLTDVSMSPNGMKAKISCTGQTTAAGTVESTWTAEGTGKTTVHITGAMGPSARPMDITMQANSVYKGADCGDIKPMPMPAPR